MSGPIQAIPKDAPKAVRHINKTLSQGPSHAWKGIGDGGCGSDYVATETEPINFREAELKGNSSPAKTGVKGVKKPVALSFEELREKAKIDPSLLTRAELIQLILTVENYTFTTPSQWEK